MQRLLKLSLPLITIVWLSLLPMPLFAANIDFKDFKVAGTSKNYAINTRVVFELSDYLRSALQNGITLNARIQFRLGKHNSWWFDDDKSLVTIPFQLKYHALSRHYLLSRNDTNEHWNFSNLPSTLRKLNELRRYVLPDISRSLGDDDGKFYILAVADLKPSTLNLPLRFQSLFSNKYQLTSEGVMWPLP